MEVRKILAEAFCPSCQIFAASFDGKNLIILCQSGFGSRIAFAKNEPESSFAGPKEFGFMPEGRCISPIRYYIGFNKLKCHETTRIVSKPYRNENLKTESSSKKMRRNRGRLCLLKYSEIDTFQEDLLDLSFDLSEIATFQEDFFDLSFDLIDDQADSYEAVIAQPNFSEADYLELPIYSSEKRTPLF